MFPPFCHESKKKKAAKFHVTRRFFSRESESLLTSPLLAVAMHPPPTLARNITLMARESIRFANVVACRLPGGVPLHTSANFFILPSSQRNIVQIDGAWGDEVDDDGDE
jgi:hypothetical protein